jgi:hypothetical protein
LEYVKVDFLNNMIGKVTKGFAGIGNGYQAGGGGYSLPPLPQLEDAVSGLNEKLKRERNPTPDSFLKKADPKFELLALKKLTNK